MTNYDENLFVGEQQKTLSRRRFLEGTLSAALASAGIYELIDTFAQPPERVFAVSPPPLEQYIIPNQQMIKDNGSGVNSSNGTILVEVPPLHDHVITATLNVSANAKALQEAQQHLESVLQGLEKQFTPTSTGLNILVAWGLPYFHHYLPSLGKTSGFFKTGTQYPNYLPVDLATSQQQKKTVYAVQEARIFPSDQPPAGFGPVRLEQNDVVILLRSDSLANIMAGTNAIFGTGSNQTGSLFKATSIRRGFNGGGFYGQQGLPSKMAVAAKIPGAQSIPPHAQVFLGFTTTLQGNMGPGIIANLETLHGMTNQWPNGYFVHGTTMHLSHLYEDLAAWYGSAGKSPLFSTYADRVQGMFRPGLSPATGTLTLCPPPELSDTNLVQDVQKYKAYGHSGSVQPVDCLATQTTSNYGTVYPTGTPISVRGDFPTLDNPFYYTSDPSGNHYSKQPAAGLHFLVFQPTIEHFNRVRLAMDGHYPDGTVLNVPPRSHHAGINAVLFTTHRQNYLVPPQNHRSFPLAEFLA